MRLRDKWLQTLETNGIAAPRALHVVETGKACVLATEGEAPGTLQLDSFQGHVLVMGMATIQHLTQRREGRAFSSDVFRGEMSLMPRGTPSEWTWKHPCTRLDVAIIPDILGDGEPFEVVNQFRFRDPELEVIGRTLFDEARRGETPERLYVESLTMQMALLLRRRYSTASRAASAVAQGGLTRPQMRRVLDYIEENLNADLALTDLAKVTDLSLHHFAHMFKQSMGAAPHRYVLERRVERAKEMLRSTRASLVDISLALGFSSQSHFSNTFRRMVGATPSEFRTQW